MAAYREALSGGDAQRGLTIFKTKAAVECIRCHKVKEPRGRPDRRRGRPRALGDRRPSDSCVPAGVDRRPQQANRTRVRVGRPGHQRWQGPHRRAPWRRRQGDSLDHRRRQTARRAQGHDRGAQRGPSAMPGDLAQKLIQGRAARPDRIPCQPEGPGEQKSASVDFFVSAALASPSRALASAGLVSAPASRRPPSCSALPPFCLFSHLFL